ncbi:hypothetical protein [Aeromonas veronii]|uniref:hypothetical protein n=1 Tax=Aeromonas veronii TaxID=654 RepID=UPI003B9E19E9
MIVDRQKVRLAVNLLLFYLGVVYIYIVHLQPRPENEALGYRVLDCDIQYYVWILVYGVITIALIPKKFDRPSSFFIMFHVLFVVFPFIVLPNIGSDSSQISFFWMWLVLVFPIILISISNKIKTTVNILPSFNKLTSYPNSYLLVFLICVFVTCLAFLNAPLSSSFDIGTSYIRRLEGRDVYPTGSFTAYANSIVMNGLGPLLAFWAGVNRNFKQFVIPIGIWLAYYYLLGIKSPLLMMTLSFFVGYHCSRDKLSKTFNYLVCILMVILLASVIETVIFNYSYISDYFIRRAFTVPPFLISVYGDFIAQNYYDGRWSFFSGFNSDIPISFVIGEQFMGKAGLNANTNAFVVAFSSGGFFLYGFICLILVLYYRIVDEVYKNRKSPSMLFCGFIFGILLIEQSATTALLSSGVIFVLLLSLILSEQSECSCH